MSCSDKCDVLIDQNRNSIRTDFTLKQSSDPQFLTQCDGIPRLAHNKQSSMKSPTKTNPCSTNETVAPKTKDQVSDGVESGSNDLDINEIGDCEILRKRVCLVKLYVWIKEEMTFSAAKAIASVLFQSEPKLLSAAVHESIYRCKRRREAIEKLLKKVLLGPIDIYDVFIAAVQKQEDTYIADRLAAEIVTEKDKNAFVQLEQSSLGKCLRPDHHLPRLEFSKSDEQTLLYHLYDKNVIEQINDHLLSRLIFSIRAHNNIVQCVLEDEKKAKCLIRTMCECAEQIFNDFCEILKTIEEPHVIQKLEKRICDSVKIKQRQKRKSTPSGEEETKELEGTSTKRRCMSTTVECNLVSSLQKSQTNLKQAVNNMGFELETINKGSIVVQITPQSKDSWYLLKENCRTGKIKDIIPTVYRNEDMKDLMEEGEYRIKFTIYTLPAAPDSDSNKALFHFESVKEEKEEKCPAVTSSSDQHSNLLEENSDLLCEELEINKHLLAVLIDKGFVSKNIKQELDKVGSRAKKIKYLLKKLETFGNKGFDVIKEFVREENPDLYSALVTREDVKSIDNKMDAVTKVTDSVQVASGKHRAVHKKERFFETTVVLKVVKNDKCKSDGKEAFDVICTDIINPCCHFEGKGKENGSNSELATLVLEDAWKFNLEKPQRKIAVSAASRKRKNEQPSELGRKRAPSLESTDSSDEDNGDANANVVKTKPELKSNTIKKNGVNKVNKGDTTKTQTDSANDVSKSEKS